MKPRFLVLFLALTCSPIILAGPDIPSMVVPPV